MLNASLLSTLLFVSLAQPEPAEPVAGADAPAPTSTTAEQPASTPDSAPPEAEPEPEPSTEPTQPETSEPEATPTTTAVVPSDRTEASSTGNSGEFKRHKIVYNNLTAIRINPLGVFNGFSLGYKYNLFNKPDSTLLRNSHLGINFTPNLSPALVGLGGSVVFEPLAVLRLTARYSYVQYFGSFQYFQSFESPESDYSDARLDAGKEAGENYTTGGHNLYLSTLLQGKVGPVVVRNELLFAYVNYSFNNATDTTWYDIQYDILQPKVGWTLRNESDILYLSKFGLTAGLRHTLTHVLGYPGFEGINPNGPTSRLGPLLAYTFYDRPEKKFNKPTLLLIAQWWLQHRYRAGQAHSQALPQIVLGFSFSGELWKK
ncbi:MAG: hypothetical protein ACPG77_05020 [Nannocystaceae bacterium]